jgi:transcriptional regulator with XRE-family HTH domain
MKIGSVVEQLRVERGWSQDDLAERIGITKSSLSRMENDNQWPRPDTLEALAAALEIKVYQLFALADAEPLPTTPSSWVQEEQDIVQAYRAMEPEARKQYRELARILADKGRTEGG